MNGCEWIVCEATSRWAAALRLALDRELQLRGSNVRLYETRLQNELASRLAERPDSFAAVEVRQQSAGETLAWLAWASGRFGRARFVALVDRGMMSGRKDLDDVLREAGALDVAHSPRQLQQTVELFRRHAALSHHATGILAANRPLEEQVWNLLPWQASATRVG